MATQTTLSGQLWTAAAPVFDRILEHPFIAGLTEGTLDRSAFRFYVVQDAHYLRAYARALSLLAARAPRESETLTFSRHAATALEVERELHESFFRDLGLTAAEVDATPLAPTNLAYTSYLLAVTYGGSFAEGLAAVLPCYWIYWEVGKALLEQGSPDPLYRRWIDTYGGEDYGQVVEAVLAITDRLGPDTSAAERERMRGHFVTTSKYEWLFWDMGWRQERWPV